MIKSKLNIIIIDDHYKTTCGIRSIVSNLFPDASIKVFTEGIQALYSIRDERYDLHIVDLEMQDIGGMTLIKEIRNKNSTAKIIVHTMHEGVWDIINLKKAGINGIVLKVSDELTQAITTVLDGGVYYCKRFNYLNKQDNDINSDTFLLNENISETELEIIRYISKGFSDKDISMLMPQSLNTIRKYRQRIFHKFDVHSSEELIVKAISNGFSITAETKQKKGY